MMCREKLGWNDILSEERLKEWRLISNDVKQAQDIEINRWYGDFKAAVKVELHVFVFFCFFWFNCYLAAPQPTLGHCQRDSLTNPMLITAF